MESISVTLLVYFFGEFVYDLGKRINIMDLGVLMMVLTCLVVPVAFYHYYTIDFPLARIWVKYMPISSDEYFSFALPAVFAMAIGLRIPLKKLQINKNPEIYVSNVRKYLEEKPNLGITLIGTGLVFGFLDFLAPANLAQVFGLAAHLSFVGVFYVIYSPSKQKPWVVTGVLALTLAQSLITGMFGELIYMLACSLTLLFLGSKIKFGAKLGYAVLGLFFIVLLQSVKADYRAKTWARESTGSDPVYFAQLIVKRIGDFDEFVNPRNLFFTSVRMNQGWLVAVTMKRVPDKYPFAYGETIGMSVAATIVPRFLWPDKPEAGGAANLKRFWGYNLVGYSMNIGPLGEAYANFDKLGGVIFMFFYGLFFNFMLSSILKFAERRPTIVLWLPFLFYYAISAETDLLTTMGSLIKGLMFTWFVYAVYRIAFRLDL